MHQRFGSRSNERSGRTGRDRVQDGRTERSADLIGSIHSGRCDPSFARIDSSVARLNAGTIADEMPAPIKSSAGKARVR